MEDVEEIQSNYEHVALKKQNKQLMVQTQWVIRYFISLVCRFEKQMTVNMQTRGSL